MCSHPEANLPAKEKLVFRESSQTKPHKQMLSIQNAFIKKSRKNITEEEFYTKDILNGQMENYLYSRIKGASVGFVKGEFSSEIVDGIKDPSYLEEGSVDEVFKSYESVIDSRMMREGEA